MNIIKNTENLLASIRDGISRLVNGKQVIGSQTVDVLSASTASLTVPAGATEAMIVAEKVGASTDPYTPVVRWSMTSTAPVTGAISTSTHGMPLFTISQPLIIKGGDSLSAFKAIAVAVTTTGNLMLKVIYYK